LRAYLEDFREFILVDAKKSSPTKKLREVMQLTPSTACFSFFLLSSFHLIHAAPPGPGWLLVLEDDFNGTALNTTLWTKGWSWYKNGVPQPPVQVKASDPDCYFDESNVYIQNGNLVILNERRLNHGYNYTSGVVNSIASNKSQGFESLYGYFEARIWGSPGGIEGMCPAFWLPNTLNNGDDGNSEIDIMEVPGGKCCGLGAAVWFTVHNKSQSDYSSYMNVTVGYWGTTYHVYGALWEPDRLCFYVDDMEQFCTRKIIPTTPSYMVLDNEIGLGGDKWAGNPDNTTFPQLMHVDWVRVWNRAQVEEK